jgi:SNF2 family DNA or RNA helicase
MEQGTGKTLTAIAVSGKGFLNGMIKRVFVFAPASVVPVWPMEYEKHADFPHEVVALEGPVKKRIENLAKWEPNPNVLQVACTNYEASWRMEQAIIKWKPDLIICDESQRIKTPGAKQSRSLHKLGRGAKYKMILTGTPISNNPLEFFSQYKFLAPHIFGNSFTAFRNRYAVMGGFEGREVVGYRNLPELMRKAHSIAYRVTKEDALDLPEWTDQVLYCDLEPAAQRVYKKLAKESVAELASGEYVTATNVLSKLLRLSQLAGGFMNHEDGHIEQVSKAKINLLADTLEDTLAAGKKVVIFARFLAEIEAIKGVMEKQGIGYEWITGAAPMEERGDRVRKFQNDPECKVFLAQIQTAGLGITLTAADTAIFYSLDFSYANYEQCKARIHRLGQKNACTYIHLLARGTVDEKVLKALQEKKNMADQIVDDWRSVFE